MEVEGHVTTMGAEEGHPRKGQAEVSSARREKLEAVETAEGTEMFVGADEQHVGTIPTPAARSNACKASTSCTTDPRSEEDREEDREEVLKVSGLDMGGEAASGVLDNSESVPVQLPQQAAHARPPSRPPSHPQSRHHSRHGSFRKHHHSRNPSDVCPRVAVIAGPEEEENVCSICLDEFNDEDPIAETSCGHGYHLQCIMQWAQRSQECPLCFSQLVLADEDMNALLPFGEYSSPQDEQAMSAMIANMEFETFLVHLAAAERRQERQQRRESRVRRRHSEDNGHVVIPSGSQVEDGGSAAGSPSESMLKSVRRGFAAFFLGGGK